MRTTSKLTALAAATASAATLAAAPAAQAAQDFAHPIESAQRFTLAPDTTQTFRMPIQGLGVNANVLMPCWGFEVAGPGVALAVADLPTTGIVFEEPALAGRPDGGIPGAQRQADGSLVIPGPAPVTSRQVTKGIACASIGWRFHDADGTPRLDPHGNPRATVVGARAASKARAKAKRLRASVKRARAAQAAPVEVLSAELHNDDPRGRPQILVTVKTGAVPAGTTLTTRAAVLPQTIENARAAAPGR